MLKYMQKSQFLSDIFYSTEFWLKKTIISENRVCTHPSLLRKCIRTSTNSGTVEFSK